jgi:hypothetical protein
MKDQLETMIKTLSMRTNMENEFDKYPRFSENKIKNRRTRLFTLIKRPDACYYYRILTPQQQLARQFGWDCKFNNIDPLPHQIQAGIPTTIDHQSVETSLKNLLDCHMEHLEWADLIVMQRPTCDHHLELMRYIQKEMKKSVTYECFTYDNQVITDQGLKQIGHIVEEELELKVMSDDGKFYPIKSYFKRRYDGQIYRIKTWYLSDDIECTETHKLIAHKRDFDDEVFEEIEAKHLRVGDFLKIPFLENEEKFPSIIDMKDHLPDHWSFNEEVVFRPKYTCNQITRIIHFDKDFSRLIGYFVAEGSVDKSGRHISFSFGDTEQEYIDDVIQIVKNKFGIGCSQFRDYEDHTIRVQVNSLAVGYLFGNLFGFANRQPNRKLPLFYFSKEIPLELIQHLLLAMFRGDGADIKKYDFYRGCRLISSSKTLLYQVHNLLLRFNIIGSIYRMHRSNTIGIIKGREVKSGEGYELKIGVIDEIESIGMKEENTYKTRNKNLKGRIDLVNKFAWIEIKSIERKEEQDIVVYNICVPPRHTYNVRMLASANSDDNYIDVPLHNPGHKYFEPRAEYIKCLIREADLLTVTTEHLADIYRPLRKGNKIAVFPNSINFETLDGAETTMKKYEYADKRKYFMAMKQLRLGIDHELYEKYKTKVDEELAKEIKGILSNPNAKSELEKQNVEFTPDAITSLYHRQNKEVRIQVPDEEYAHIMNGKTMIGWSGSPTHREDLAVITNPLMKILHENPEVVLGMWGFIHHDWLNMMDRNQLWLFGLVPVKYYYSAHKQVGFSISLCPVNPDQFNRGKSNLKCNESCALGQYAIASKYATYEGCPPNVPLCSTHEDWEREINLAINDEAMRMEVNIQNRQFVEEHYDIAKNVDMWKAAYEDLI